MKVEAENELIGFQTWLNYSLRHAWILAFAVAIPGAFLLTLWFPHSPEALVGVTILGIGIGALSDAFENARNRRKEEIAQITRALAATERSDNIDAVAKLEEIRGALDRQVASIRSIEGELYGITSFLVRLLIELPTKHEIGSSSSEREPRSRSPSTTRENKPAIQPMTQGEADSEIVQEVMIRMTQVANEMDIAVEKLWKYFLVADPMTKTAVKAKIDPIAKEMNMPIETFWRYVKFIATKSETLVLLQKRSE